MTSLLSLPDVQGFSYLILGYAKSGRAAAACLRASGAKVWVWDDAPASREAARQDGFESAEDLGALDFASFKAVIAAPGIPLSLPAPHPALIRAKEAGTPLSDDIDLLFAAQSEARYIGITGTNGKSTTTALIAHILQEAGMNVAMGGNIGTPALSLPPLGKTGIYVLELSSFQLDLMQTNKIDVAVWLNVTPDHFDRHGDMEGYIAAKRRIVRKDAPQTVILGVDEPETRRIEAELKTQGNLTLRTISVLDPARQGWLYPSDGSEPFDLAPCHALLGPHNAQNAAAAYEACRAVGVPRETILKALVSFPGLAHRQQLVGTIKGVRFINDSKATNADAASKALACFDPIYWIIGGKPKVGGLAGLESFAPRIAHAFLIGQASADFAAWCEKQSIPYTLAQTLDLATQQAAAMAWKDGKKDAAVLLSPACASFDQFTGFEARGDFFAHYVRALADKED